MAISAAERPAFFEGQYLGAADLEALVTYFRTQDARQILGHHAWGIAVGLDLVEAGAPDGTLEVFVQPGVAFDGYGRIIAVLNRTKVDAAKFAGAPSGEVEVWIRYDESQKQGVRKGFEVCTSDDVFSRVNESFFIEVGAQTSVSDRQSGVVVNGEVLEDARDVLHQLDDKAPLLCDASVPHQDFRAAEDRTRWLVPLGLVRWQASSSTFEALTDEQRVRCRRKRRYVGVVAESVYATDGLIRLRNRYTPFDPSDESKTNDRLCNEKAAEGTDFYMCGEELRSRELVWLEGHTRVTGDFRIFGKRLEFRDDEGTDYIDRTVDGVLVSKSAPMLMQRHKRPAPGGTDLQILIGEDADGSANRLTVGRATTSGGDLCDLTIDAEDRVVIQDDGKVGIGAVDTALESALTIRGIGDENDLLAFENDTPDRRWHINMGADKNGLNFVETGSDASRVYLASGGNVGVGTTDPDGKLTVEGNGGGLRLYSGKDGGHFWVGFYTNGSPGSNRSGWIGYSNDGAADLTIRNQTANGDIILEPNRNVGISSQAPEARLHVKDSISGNASSVSAHVAAIENTSGTGNADVLALKVATTSVGTGNNFITFFDGNSAVGSIEGLGGNISWNPSGADYAEWLPKRDLDEAFEAADVIAVSNGQVSKNCKAADQVLVVSTAPAVAANRPKDEERSNYERVAFFGQVPVKVVGAVQSGDWLVPSGQNDGTAVAVSAKKLTTEQFNQIVGQAWESSDEPAVKIINAYMGNTFNQLLPILVKKLAK